MTVTQSGLRVLGFLLLSALALASSAAHAQKAADALANLNRDLAKIKACYSPFSARCLVDLTPDDLIQKAGGREAMIAAVEQGLKVLASQVKAEFEKVQYKPDAATSPLGKLLVVKVLQEFPIEVQGKQGQLSGALIAVSSDNGANWKFVDANTRDIIEQIYPGAWDLLKIPAPKFTPKS